MYNVGNNINKKGKKEMWWFGSFKSSPKDTEGLGEGALISLLIVHIVFLGFMLLAVYGLLALWGVGFWDFVRGVFIFFAILYTLSII